MKKKINDDYYKLEFDLLGDGWEKSVYKKLNLPGASKFKKRIEEELAYLARFQQHALEVYRKNTESVK